MSLLEKIKQASVEARKQRDKAASFLVTLYSEAAMIGKNAGNRETLDEEVIKVVKKFIKNLDETIEALKTRGDAAAEQIAKALEEKAILEQYLPKMLTEAEIETLIDHALLAGYDNVGKVLGFIKTKVDAAAVDMKFASQVIKDKLDKK